MIVCDGDVHWRIYVQNFPAHTRPIGPNSFFFTHFHRKAPALEVNVPQNGSTSPKTGPRPPMGNPGSASDVDERIISHSVHFVYFSFVISRKGFFVYVDFYCPCMREGNVFILSVCVCVSLSIWAIPFECLCIESSNIVISCRC